MEALGALAVVLGILALEGGLVAIAIGLLAVVAPLSFLGFVAVFLGMHLHQVRQTLVTSPPGARHVPPREPGPGQQPAYRQYFLGQGWADLELAAGASLSRCEALTRQAARAINKHCFTGDQAWMLWMFGVVAVAGLLVGAIAGFAAVLLTAAAHTALLAVAHAVSWAGILALRVADTAMLRLRGIRITCGSCHHRVPYPAYECPGPGCARRHGDVRPGPYGVFQRVCACGTRLPTLLILGSSRLRAFCVYCREPLVGEAGTAPEVLLPLLGATTAGKTRLMLATVRAVADLTAAAGAGFAFADAGTERRYRELLPALLPGHQTRQTVAGDLPRAYSMYVAPAASARRLLHVFDVAGERFVSRQRTEELRYLGLAGHFLFVLDPLSIEPFWRELPAPEQARLTSFRAVQPPEELFVRACEQMQLMGARTRDSRLAVAVSKYDLVRELRPFAGVDGDAGALERCLVGELQLGNLVRTMRREFAEVRFLATAALLDEGGVPDASVVAVGRWLLAGAGVTLRTTDR